MLHTVDASTISGKNQFPLDKMLFRKRNGEYEPQIIGKYSRSADGMEEKVLGLYAFGTSQRDVPEQIKNLNDVGISPKLMSKISEKIMPEVTTWQNRPLEAVYPFAFLDALHYKVKEKHQYQANVAYVVLDVTMDGTKDILNAEQSMPAHKEIQRRTPKWLDLLAGLDISKTYSINYLN